ncbi:MAG: hypothetical protein RLZZ387_259 [Chloroflexota bacterium]|jgi:hypothetical protein
MNFATGIAIGIGGLMFAAHVFSQVAAHALTGALPF